jgi:serine/threonine-protein kinase
MSSVPQNVGPYRLDSLVGRGGMGEVYRAYDARLDRWVAIKHLRSDRVDHGTAALRLRREARAIAALRHPVIVPIFDILETPEGDWIVMEWVEGTTVAERLREGPLSREATLVLARQVAAGLAHAHAKGFLHRDLKAENVMLSPETGVRILDFGLAKRYGGEAGAESALTQDGQLVGTGRSLSPEQAQGQPVDARSDLFSACSCTSASQGPPHSSRPPYPPPCCGSAPIASPPSPPSTKRWGGPCPTWWIDSWRSCRSIGHGRLRRS